jgi:hypothetical protein
LLSPPEAIPGERHPLEIGDIEVRLGRWGGTRMLRFGTDTLFVMHNQQKEKRLDLALVKSIHCEHGQEVWITYETEPEPLKYLAKKGDDAEGIVAMLMAKLHEYNVDVAIPFLIQRMKERREDRAQQTHNTHKFRGLQSDERLGLAHQKAVSHGHSVVPPKSGDPRVSTGIQTNWYENAGCFYGVVRNK